MLTVSSMSLLGILIRVPFLYQRYRSALTLDFNCMVLGVASSGPRRCVVVSGMICGFELPLPVMVTKGDQSSHCDEPGFRGTRLKRARYFPGCVASYSGPVAPAISDPSRSH